MGLNIIGLATTIKTDNLSNIATLLNIRVSEEFEELTFEEAISNSVEEDDIFLTLTSNGTILTVGEDVPIFELPLKPISANGKALRFMVGETSMTFAFSYYENSKLLRSVMAVEDGRKEESGKMLDIEFTGADMSDVIFEVMRQTTGDDVYSIEPDVKSIRYKFIGLVANATEPQKTNPPQTTKKKDNPKPWWKIW